MYKRQVRPGPSYHKMMGRAEPAGPARPNPGAAHQRRPKTSPDFYHMDAFSVQLVPWPTMYYFEAGLGNTIVIFLLLPNTWQKTWYTPTYLYIVSVIHTFKPWKYILVASFGRSNVGFSGGCPFCFVCRQCMHCCCSRYPCPV